MALAFFVINVIDPSGNDAVAQATSLSAPTTPVASDAGATAVNVTWTNPGIQVPGASYEAIANPGGAFCATSSNSCQVTGLTPGTSYVFSVNAFLDNWNSSSITTSFTTLGVTTASLPNGTYGTPYSTNLAATGGSGTYSHWALTSGTLPSWATLNSSTGAITGTPTAPGTTAGLVFTVTDSNSFAASSSPLTITVGKDTTTATVSESPTSVTYGNESASVFTATVTTGHHEVLPGTESATINVGSTSCTASLAPGGNGASGTCTIANTALAASGTAYTVSFTYAGDTDLLASAQATATTGLTVNKDSATVTSFTVNSGSSATTTYGNENASVGSGGLSFSATVTSGHGEAVPGTDTVTVTQGATTICTMTLTSGSGTCVPSSGTIIPAGTYTNGITATFNSAGADTNFVSTATATTSVTVNKDSATVSLKVNSGSSATTTYGNENASVGSGGLSFSATVTATHGEAVPGTDTVTVTEGAVTVCSFTVRPAPASVELDHHPGGHLHQRHHRHFQQRWGRHQLHLHLDGHHQRDGEQGLGHGDLVPVNSGSSATTTYGNENASVGSGGLSFSATVTSGHGEAVPGTDTVTVTQGATTICTMTLTSGSGTCVPSSGTIIPAGTYTNGITATFNSAGADTNFVSTATATTSVTVNKDSATVSLKVNSGSSATTTYGNENASVGSGGLSFSATVTATHGEAVPGTDTVTVTEGAVTVCSFPSRPAPACRRARPSSRRAPTPTASPPLSTALGPTPTSPPPRRAPPA